MSAQTAQTLPEELAYEQQEQQRRTDTAIGATYGYIRVGIKDPSEADQLMAIQKAGVPSDCVFIERALGANTVEYAHLLRALRAGDSLIVTSLDKLGTCYDDVIAQWQLLTRIKKVHMVVLDIPLLDTRKQQYGLVDTFIADLALQFMAYAATREREGIRQRQREGILAAKERGVRFGRPPKPIPPQFEKLLAQWRRREISSRKAAQQLGVAQETFLRWSRKWEQNGRA